MCKPNWFRLMVCKFRGNLELCGEVAGDEAVDDKEENHEVEKDGTHHVYPLPWIANFDVLKKTVARKSGCHAVSNHDNAKPLAKQIVVHQKNAGNGNRTCQNAHNACENHFATQECTISFVRGI